MWVWMLPYFTFYEEKGSSRTPFSLNYWYEGELGQKDERKRIMVLKYIGKGGLAYNRLSIIIISYSLFILAFNKVSHLIC